MITDHNMGWLRKRKRYTATEMHGIIDNATTGVPESAKTSTVNQLEMGVSGFVGYNMLSAETIAGLIPVPYDVDPGWDLGFRIIYSGNHDGTGTAIADWNVKAATIKKGNPFATPSGNLGVVIPPHTYADGNGNPSTTDNLYQQTERGIYLKEDHVLSREQIEEGVMLSVLITANTITNFTGIYFIMLEMDYVPMRCIGGGNYNDAALKCDQSS